MNLIFDLDGTLVDSRPGILFSLRFAMGQVFPDSHPDSLEFAIGPPVREMFNRTLENPTKRILDKLEASFRSIYDSEGWKMSHLFPGVIETLDEFHLRNTPMYIITNKPGLATGRILEKLGLLSFFTEVVSPDSRRPPFNDKAGSLRYLLEKYAMKNDHTVYVGDSIEDLTIAEAFNIPFVGVEYGYGSFGELSRQVHLVGDFPGLLHGVTTWSDLMSAPQLRRNDMINRDIFEELFVLELANNHWGDVQRGLEIIKEFGTVVRYNDVHAAIKLQFRDVDTFIHKDFVARDDIRYIKKTRETRLSREELAALVEAIRRSNCVRLVTPFDEKSVELCIELGIEIIKVASSDVTDWPLLEKIAKTRKPVVVSTGGSSLNDIDNMVMFFEHRNIPLAINHCVAIYPAEDAELQLNQIDFLKHRYPGHVIGLSTHEYHDWRSSLLIAYAKGARTFERHIDIKSDNKPISPYCSTPEQVAEWFQAFKKAKEMCGAAGNEKVVSTQKEIDYLTTLVRGVYARHDLPAGHVLMPDDYYLAIPLQKGQLSCRELLNDQVLSSECKKDAPLMVEMVDSLYNRDEILRKQIYARGF
jgi:sialic acid synthase SpsE/phosphoglycolate phosphatase-like HAD superfamily hydrolase